jgi:hypothetical protein
MSVSLRVRPWSKLGGKANVRAVVDVRCIQLVIGTGKHQNVMVELVLTARSGRTLDTRGDGLSCVQGTHKPTRWHRPSSMTSARRDGGGNGGEGVEGAVEDNPACGRWVDNLGLGGVDVETKEIHVPKERCNAARAFMSGYKDPDARRGSRSSSQVPRRAGGQDVLLRLLWSLVWPGAEPRGLFAEAREMNSRCIVAVVVVDAGAAQEWRRRLFIVRVYR